MPLSISQLAEACGVSEDTLRSWERRYHLPEPAREPNGYRSYSHEQAAILRQMARLVHEGFAPRHAAQYVLGDADALRPVAPRDFVRRLSGRVWDDSLAIQLQLVLTAAGLAQQADDWLLPMLQLVGDDCVSGRLGIEHEHALSSAVMGRLHHIRAGAPPSRRGAAAVLAGLPAGSRHEIGVYTFAVALQLAGWPVVYLGSDLPTSSWANAVSTHKPAAIVTAITTDYDVGPAQHLVDELSDASPGLLIGIGGAQQSAIDNPTAVRLGHSLARAQLHFEALLTDLELAPPEN